MNGVMCAVQAGSPMNAFCWNC